MSHIFVEDLVGKHEGEKEDELPYNATIRFEGMTANFSICMNGQDELEIYKICKNAIDDSDEINVRAPSCNKFIIC